MYIILSKDSTPEEIAPVYELGVGDAFKYNKNYETVIGLVKKNIPDGMTFEIYPVLPGTALFASYGENTIVITAKSAP
jgi:hypothetical protein